MTFEWDWSDDSSETQSIYTIRPKGVVRQNPKLTHGVELEFNVPYIIKGQKDPHPDQPQRVLEVLQDEQFGRGPLAVVMRALRQQIELVYGEQGHQASDIMILGYPGSTDPEHKKWDLKEDGSVNELQFRGKDGYAGYISVEIASRIFTSHDWNDITRSEYVTGQIVRYIRYETRIRFNSTCGFHVHVGLEDQLPNNLFAVKRLATVLWLGGDLLEPLYHPVRRDGSGLNDYCESLTKYSSLASFIPEQGGSEDGFYKTWLKDALSHKPDLDINIAAIWNAEDIFDLVQLLRPAPGQIERLSYNFLNLCGPQSSGTIEFRSMEATCNEELVKHWPRVCKKLILYAKRNPIAKRMGKTENEHFQDMVKALIDRAASLDTSRFLQMLCCDQDTIEFFQRKQEWDAASWTELRSSHYDLDLDIFPYRPQAGFFQDQLTTEYGRSF